MIEWVNCIQMVNILFTDKTLYSKQDNVGNYVYHLIIHFKLYYEYAKLKCKLFNLVIIKYRWLHNI